MDSEDKTAAALIVGGLGVAFLAMSWQAQLLNDLVLSRNLTGDWSAWLEANAAYFRASMIPALMVCIGYIVAGLSAFVRTKTHVILKTIAVVYILFFVMMAIGRLTTFLSRIPQ
jgi:hypothetical protein